MDKGPLRILYAMPAPGSTGGMRMITQMYFSEQVFERDGYFYFDTFYSWGEGKAIRFVQNIFQKIQFAWVLLTKRIDVVYVMTSSFWGFYDKIIFCLIARILGKKVVLNPVGGHFILFYEKSRFSRFIVPKLLNIPTGVISGTTYWYEYFRNTFHLKHLRDIPNPVVVPPNSKKYHSASAHPLTITFLARVEKEKGALVFAEYVRKALEAQSRHQFVFAGKGPALDEVTQLLSPFSDNGQVQILGFISENEKNELLEKTDIYVLPTEFEVLPVSLLEAMSHGCIVVTTAVGGIPDAVVDGQTGFLLNHINADEIARVVKMVESDPSLLPKIGEQARKKIQESYSLEFVIQKQLEFFQDLCR